MVIPSIDDSSGDAEVVQCVYIEETQQTRVDSFNLVLSDELDRIDTFVQHLVNQTAGRANTLFQCVSRQYAATSQLGRLRAGD